MYYRRTEMMPRAKAAALKAIEHDDTVGKAHAIVGLVKSVYEFDRAGADQGLKRAIAEKPSDA
jgi:hypothetical protein